MPNLSILSLHPSRRLWSMLSPALRGFNISIGALCMSFIHFCLKSPDCIRGTARNGAHVYHQFSLLNAWLLFYNECREQALMTHPEVTVTERWYCIGCRKGPVFNTKEWQSHRCDERSKQLIFKSNENMKYDIEHLVGPRTNLG